MSRRFLVPAVLVACACSRATTPPVVVSATRELGTRPLHALAVMPAEVAPQSSDVAAGAAATVTEIVQQAVAKEARWTLVEPEKVSAILSSLSDPATEAPAVVVGRRIGADAVLTTTIQRFHERVGADYGAQEPASVALEMLLVSPQDGAPAWKATYAFTQQPLAYNLWNFWTVLREGPRWLTAAEIARIGIEEALSRLAAVPTSR